ncbi:MAG: TadE/TadG family type IV pilus assembly protein [Rhizobium sp.]
MRTDFRFDFGFRRWWGDRSGNFGILTAIAVPLLLASGGVAVDVSTMVLSKGQMQAATDAAALATASALAAGTIDTTTATQFAKDFVSGQMSNYLTGNATAMAAVKSGTTVNVTQTANGANGKIFAVSVNSAYNMDVNGLTHLLGLNTVNIGTRSSTSSATESKNALSMYLVLDRSGSMDELTDTVDTQTCTKTKKNGSCKTWSITYFSKMEALKIAVANLTATLNKADPNMMYVRTGGDSFNDKAQTESAIAWGTSNISTYVNNLTADGMTNSDPPMANAYRALSASTEDSLHKAKNGQVPTKYIVFMTDGDNTVSGDPDGNTRKTCDAARAAGMQVYTVALMAPANGQKLLKYCATSTSTYFDAENSDDLIAAFKAIGEKATAQLTLMTK